MQCCANIRYERKGTKTRNKSWRKRVERQWEEGEKEREKERDGQRERDRVSECMCECVCVCLSLSVCVCVCVCVVLDNPRESIRIQGRKGKGVCE